MKLLKLTEIKEYETKYYVQQGLQTIQQNALGGILQGIGPAYSQPYQQSVSYSESKRKYCFLLEDFKYMVEVKDQKCKTEVFFKDNKSIYVEETIDQIERQIHQMEFNTKMDEILK